MNKLFLQLGGILACLGVVLGAFGAHALKKLWEGTNTLETFETAVKYQFYHAIGLLLIGVICKEINSKYLVWSGNLMFAGVLIFSGALYLICFTGLKTFGAVAPIGGTLLVLAWAMFVYAVSGRN